MTRGSASGGYVVWIGDAGANTAQWETSERIPPQGGLKDEGTAALEREGQWVGVYPSGGGDDRSGSEEVDNYVSRCQNKVAQFIATRPIMELCLAAERRQGSQVAKRWR